MLLAVAACAATMTIILASFSETKRRQKRSTKRRSCWTRPWVLRRPMKGAYTMLVEELRLEDPASYKNYLRMDEETFAELVARVTPHIQRQGLRE